MAATGVQLNWTGVAFAGTTITRVTSITLDQGASIITFAGDNARYPQVAAVNMNNPTISLTGGDIALLWSFTGGLQGVFTATQKDAISASGGDIVWTTTAQTMKGTTTNSGPFSQFATATANFQCVVPDGITPPISVARA